MPKIKKGLNYFDIETDINSDMRVKMLRAEFGIKGFGIWIQLLIQIYADEGYFLKWNKDTNLLFASDVGVSGALVDEVVNGAVKRGLFSESVFNSLGILTSKHIQEKYFGAIKRRESELKVDARYLVIPCNVDIIKSNVNIKIINVNKTKQSRVEESKVEESKVNNAREVNAFVGMELEQLPKLNTPLQADELEKLRADFSDTTVRDVLIAMENHKKLTKKYTSAYLTAINWCKRRNENHGQSESTVRTAGDREVDQLRNTHF